MTYDVAMALKWNRVANLHGGAGRNLGLDLINEFLNNDFKGKSICVIKSSILVMFAA